MMPDLGKYALEVGLAYAVSLSLIGVLVWLSLARDRKTRRDLQDLEERRGRDGET